MFRWRPSLPVPFQDQLKADDHIAWLTVTPGSNHLLNDSQEKLPFGHLREWGGPCKFYI